MISIRRASIGDAPIVASLSRKLAEEEGWPPCPPADLLLQNCRIELSKLSQQFFLAWSDHLIVEAVGLLGIEHCSASLLGEYLDVGRFYVEREWRHRGVGRKLLAHALDYLPPSLELPVLCMTRDGGGPGRASYRRMGFQPIGTLQTTMLSTLRKSLHGR